MAMGGKGKKKGKLRQLAENSSVKSVRKSLKRARTVGK